MSLNPTPPEPADARKPLAGEGAPDSPPLSISPDPEGPVDPLQIPIETVQVGPSEGAAQPASGGTEALGRSAMRGFALMLMNIGVGRLLQLGAVVVMGGLLEKGDFGLVSIALSIAMFIQTFRDGGVHDYLIANQKDFDKIAGPCYWLVFWINLFLAAAIGITGEIAARYLFAQGKIESVTDLTTLMWILAIAVPLNSPTTTRLAKLKIDLRFTALSIQSMMTSVIRYGGQIAFALAGWGPVGYIMPVILLPIADNIFLFLTTTEKAWKRKANREMWLKIIKSSKWIVLASLAAGIANHGFAVCASPFLSAETALEVTGSLFFAISILLALEGVLAQSLIPVMLPVLSRMRDEPVRQANAALRVLILIMLLAVPTTFAVALVFPAISRLIWASKWDEAAIAIMILVPAFVLRNAVATVTIPLAQSRGWFASSFAVWGQIAIAAAGGAVIGAIIADSVIVIAAAISTLVSITALHLIIKTLKQAEISRRRTLDAVMRPMLICAVVGALVLVLDRYAFTPLAKSLITATVTIKDEPRMMFEALRAVLVGGTFAVLAAAGLRLLAAGPVRDAVSVMPVRLAGPARKILRI
ncbi:MAG: oligosaccharide flippase family protein [Phycisphaerales bacterium]|nr:oligosaccharide flippase family protein [Phycisphaerales bacterium]